MKLEQKLFSNPKFELVDLTESERVLFFKNTPLGVVEILRILLCVS